MYDKTQWRPTYFVSAEGIGKTDEYNLRKDIEKTLDKNTHFFVQIGQKGIFNNFFQSKCKSYKFFTTCNHGITHSPPEKWHLPTMCHYGGSLFVAMQYATVLGYSPLYLVGCDLAGGHFKGYGSDKNFTDVWLKAHEIAHKSRDEIYNATEGGILEFYPRVDIMEVL